MEVGMLRIVVPVFTLFMIINASVEAKDFHQANIIFEQNVTDNDAEVVLFIKSADRGLISLNVFAPNGSSIVSFISGSEPNLGLREFALESPEPGIDIVKNAYPEGIYRIVGRDTDGETYTSDVLLSHSLPTVSEPFVKDVSQDFVTIGWTAIESASGLSLEVENDQLGFTFEILLPSTATSFSIPKIWLKANTIYELGLTAYSETGNVSVTETAFAVSFN